MITKNLKIFILIFFILIFLPNVTLSQIILPPAEANFTYQSLALVKFGADEIKGYPEYLDIEWEAYYLTGENQPIGADCYFNCPNAEVYGATFGPCQNCSSVTYPNLTGVCTIKAPNYLIKQLNNVTCRFYNPLDPNKVAYVELVDSKVQYPFVTFWPINFNISVSTSLTVTVGQTFELPVYIKNLGIIVDSYTVNVTPTGTYAYLATVDGVSKTDNASYGEIASALPKITFSSTTPDPVKFRIKVKSNTEPRTNLNTSCTTDADCSYLGDSECYENRCWKISEISIKAGSASLPEFDWLGIFQIMLLATISLVFVGKKLR